MIASAPPSATPTPCAVRNRPPVAVNIVEPQYPPKFRVNADTTVYVKVLIAADGSVQGASVLITSGYKEIDDAAVIAAKKSTYEPKIENCKPVASAAAYRATFTIKMPEPEASDTHSMRYTELLASRMPYQRQSTRFADRNPSQ